MASHTVCHVLGHLQEHKGSPILEEPLAHQAMPKVATGGRPRASLAHQAMPKVATDITCHSRAGGSNFKPLEVAGCAVGRHACTAY